MNEQMLRGARRLVAVCARVQAGESALIVTDDGADPVLGLALYEALREAGAKAALIKTPNGKSDSGEPDPKVTAAMGQADVVFAPVSVSITHTDAVRNYCAANGRVVALTQWIPDMMAGGGIDADFAAIEPRVLRMAAIWDKGSSVHVQTKAGTDLVLDITGRLGTPHAKTSIVRPGTFHPVPDIESPVSPVTSEGVIVCDASIPYLGIGVLETPVRLEVKNGNVMKISGGWAADRVRDAWAAMNDPHVYNVAEIGIGMNPSCRLIGSMLEDEGVATTCHIGVGTSTTLGGTIKASCHYDFIMHDPTIAVDGEVVMAEGVLLVE